MKASNNLEKRIWRIKSITEFNELAIEIFHFQYELLPVYKSYIDRLSINPSQIKHPCQIPFLPIAFFKTHIINCYPEKCEKVFSSSMTTGANPSKHFVHHLDIYDQSILNGFHYFFRNIGDFVVLALLPSHLERKDASLVYMAKLLIASSGSPDSGFYLHDHKKLISKIDKLRLQNKKIVLLGVTFALLELAEKFHTEFSGVTIMETGGMKGQRKELIREEVHSILCSSFGVSKIYSEYGMTELLSQAYSMGYGIFECPPWMQVLIRDVNDPLSLVPTDETGGINIIDLANLYSCSFIASQDLGRLHPNGNFEVLGRFDQSDVRGCNLMLR